MGKMFKRKSVLYTWCLSYGLLLLMMVVMCIMLGRNARNQLISEYKSITQTLQKQSNNAINDYFDELERCAYEISNDYLVNDFVSTPDPSGSKYYNLQPIQQSLSVYALQSGGEVSRYLYMDNIGRALSSDAIFRLHEFYASLGLEAAMSAAEESCEETVSDLLSLKSVLGTLTKEERTLIYLRFFKNKTQSETARVLHTTQVQISRKERKLLAAMREQLTD